MHTKEMGWQLYLNAEGRKKARVEIMVSRRGNWPGKLCGDL